MAHLGIMPYVDRFSQNFPAGPLERFVPSRVYMTHPTPLPAWCECRVWLGRCSACGQAYMPECQLVAPCDATADGLVYAACDQQQVLRHGLVSAVWVQGRGAWHDLAAEGLACGCQARRRPVTKPVTHPWWLSLWLLWPYSMPRNLPSSLLSLWGYEVVLVLHPRTVPARGLCMRRVAGFAIAFINPDHLTTWKASHWTGPRSVWTRALYYLNAYQPGGQSERRRSHKAQGITPNFLTTMA